ncbi:carbohydrate ABC transporter membrane protein 1 (CUT1 family) [Halanaerobium saccharolyticum]|uniref:Carbohydrate ABC transporter membrane protein 1 (CUT1 family) n=1 Tax=Halanaerobium saccharolyticum TaxID=43595 RepID=A0A4V3CEA5_9FIRM|nr:sugar ABC transporter permease [Halanaerobium saccharolyticum]TDO85913.1 carbohydrate ABC transporter membrane protein 1 (CUT1 family) [Halanaerobium saccharolyticum]
MIFYNKKNKYLTIFLFLLPSVLGLIIFGILPMLGSLTLSFSEWDIISGPPKLIGLDNFINILKGNEFWRVLNNILYYIILYIPLILISSLSLALLLNNKFKGIKIYRTLYYIPVITSWVAGSLIWKIVLNPQFGVLNNLLNFIGLQGPGWLYDQSWAMPGIVLASIWKDVGFFGLILFSGLRGISPTYYEAAEIDGANSWQRFKSITLPLISPTLLFVIIISLINSFQLFPQVMIMTQGGPNGATQVMVERIYKYAFQYYKMGYASAFSWLLFIIVFVVTLLQMKLQKRWVHYES